MHAPRLRFPVLPQVCLSLALCAPPLAWAARQTPETPPSADTPPAAAATPPAARAPAAKTPRAANRVSRQWRSQRFVYKAESKRVSEVLLDFASSQGLPAVMADGIEGTVQASFDTTPEKFLDSMTRAYGIVWYHDGTALYFYPAGSVQSRLFRLKGFRREQVAELLESLQLGDSRFPLRFNASESTLLVYGPPRHVELIAAAVESLDVGAMERNRKTVRVVPLRFASAGDRNFGQTRIRGIASTLTSLYGGATNGPAAAADAPTMVEVQPEKLRAMQGVMGRDTRLADVMARKPGQATSGQPSQKGAGAGSSARGLQSPVDDETPPVFEADEGTNSVVIHGRPQRMDEYIDLIRRLDVQPVLVELEATIIDVSSDSIDSLGIDWNVRGSKSSFGVSQPASDTSGTFTLSTLWSNAGRELMARINALSARGKARVIAKPKVLGVANRPAVMREKRVVTVRVAGNLEANVFQIEAGTLLQVTPQITSIADGTGVSRRIKLSLYIEDGSFEADRVDNVPIVKRTEIMTEAHVGEGESLLIGGITTTNQSTRRDEVPVLGRVPVLGGLFRQTSELSGSSERLFLISPRLIREPADLPPTAAGTNNGTAGNAAPGQPRGMQAPLPPASVPAPSVSTPVPESFMHDAGSAS
ncbi:type III secretion system outer membrane ring subunit SctC [Roseateles amylovorans]|uniref:Type 3 secretion system secretin n=1 Tax=Roseateles amylovorans TaxID=2978473 RepID=A0ABY6B4T2_9BURK|nr:type III secretion system outer membrane ring subunit SctC [Roseateles amylovorans]UXH78275.1 type III secretion system outer membrane ring subunit SctC [Roseateles amylovorans]